MKQLKTPIEDLMPSDALMHQAWTDCLLWSEVNGRARNAMNPNYRSKKTHLPL